MSSEHSLTAFVNITVSLHKVILNNGRVQRLPPNSWNFSLSTPCCCRTEPPTRQLPLPLLTLIFKSPHPRTCLLIFRERGRKGGRERERNMDVREIHRLAASGMHPDWGPNLQPGCVPDQESKLQPFGLQDNAQPRATPARADVN